MGTQCSVFVWRIFATLCMLVAVDCFQESVCEVGFAPPLPSSESHVELAIPPTSDVESSKAVYLMCPPGFMVCGIDVYRLKSSLVGNVHVIRDMVLQCCHGHYSMVSVLSLVQNYSLPVEESYYYDYLYDGFYKTNVGFLSEVTSFSLSPRSIYVNSMHVLGVHETVPTQTCPVGGALSGIYSVVLDSGGNMSYMQSPGGVCSRQCVVCPINHYCPGNVTAIPCQSNAKAAAGSVSPTSCECDIGFTGRDGFCYCPEGTFLTPHDTPCAPCPPNSICSGDNTASPCPGNSSLWDSVCVCDDGFFGVSGVCVECLTGSYCVGGVSSTCWNNSVALQRGQQTCDCLVGFHESVAMGVRECRTCPTGFFCLGGRNPSPIPCYPGTYSEHQGSTQCASCPPNSGSLVYGATQKSTCECAPGFMMVQGHGLCSACPPGSYCPGFGNSSVPCRSGTYHTGTGLSDQSACIQCASGTYSEATGAFVESTCVACGLGTFQPFRGARAVSHCLQCPAGSYGNTSGLPRCHLCPRGTVLTARGAREASACAYCMAGTYQTGEGMDTLASCLECPGGTYQTGVGQFLLSSCMPCAAGTYQPKTGQPFVSECIPCNAGHFQTREGAQASADCQACAIGTYQTLSGSALPCTQCPGGTYGTLQGATSYISGCVSCVRGTYQTGVGVVNSSSCLYCEAGTVQPNLQATSQEECVACPQGTYQSMMGGSGFDSCISCGNGTYQPGLGASGGDDCLPCGKGRYQSRIGATAETECAFCAAGTYQSMDVAGGVDLCILCTAGTYQPVEGASTSRACMPCSTGTYQTLSGATSGERCELCGAGTYQSMKGAGTPLACIQCPRGTFQTGFAMTTPDACVACRQGKYSSGLGMGGGEEQVCMRCAAGTYQPLDGVGASTCIKCERGKFQTAPGQTNCSLCRPGTYQPFEGVGVDWWCKPCDQGTYSSSAGASAFGSCTPCPAGTASDGTGAVNCTMCSLGKYSSSVGGHACFSCMSGTYANDTGASRCGLCPPGSRVDVAGASMCPACPPGQHQFQSGASDCLVCPTGRFQSQPGATFCSSCPAGLYQPDVNGSQCLECPPGTYGGGEGLSACIPCIAGEYQADASQTTCIGCHEGGFQDSQGMTFCSLCSPGYFQPARSAVVCTACKPGEYQHDAGTTACEQCGVGSYHAIFGANSSDMCLNCSAGSYARTEGATRCDLCEPGTYAIEEGTTLCYTCDRGTFQSSAGSSECSLCPPGAYSVTSGLSSVSLCSPCPAGTYSTSWGATSCVACEEGMFGDLEGTTNCSQCQAGTYVSERGWQRRGCTPCPAGTFSNMMGAVSVLNCSLCPDGFYSGAPGMTSASACQQCQVGTVSVDNKTLCKPCGMGEFCPAGYHAAILCVPGLVCNGTHMNAGLGMLIYNRGNCTGAIPCPKGTRCWLRSVAQGRGLLPSSQANQTHFVVYENGSDTTAMSCLGEIIHYGYARLDPPVMDPPGVTVLYRLDPMACPIGTYLNYDTCTSCPSGTFSSLQSALAWDSCVPCPAGTYSSLTGVSACLPCPEGGYCKAARLTTWQACRAGTYQPAMGASSCLPCSPGSFSRIPRARACDTCSAGTFQSTSGATACSTCLASQFSSPGDHVCSVCGADLVSLDPGFSCTPPTLPLQKEGLMWINLRGNGGTDECLSTGSAPATALRDPNQVLMSYVIMTHRHVTCESTLRVVDRPELRQTWVNNVGTLRRPTTIRVIPFNNTFYPELCKRQGFGVLFTVTDEYGHMLTNMTGGRATMSMLDLSGQNTLFSMGCDRLPNDPNAKIPIGVCRTSFCPIMSIVVRVTLSWVPGISAQTLRAESRLNPGPVGVCPPVASWMAAVELLRPSMPYFPGDEFDVRVSVLNPPPDTRLVVFRFAMRILGGVSLISFQSTYSVVTETVANTVSVVGDASLGGGTVLGTMRFRVDATVSGVGLVIQVVDQSFQFTLANAIPYTMLVRTAGFSCRSDGYIDVLLDMPRATSLIVLPRRNYVVNWRRIQTTASDIPTGIQVVAVNNVMHSFAPVLATCTSVDWANFDIASCDVIRGGNVGNSSGLVRVRHQGLSADVAIESWVPTEGSWGIVVSPGGVSGRYRVRVTLSAGAKHIANVDATPFLNRMVAFGVSLDEGQWRCRSRGTRFTIGVPTMYTGVCGESARQVAGDIPRSFFLVSGPLRGVREVGSYIFPPAVISAALHFGGLLLISSAGTSIALANHSSLSTLGQLVPYSADPVSAVALRNTGVSARCVQIVLHPQLSHAWNPFTAVIPVFPAGPRSLHVTLSTYVILSSHLESDDFIPATTFVIQAALTFSDGSQLPIQSDVRLRMTSSTLDVTGLAAMAPAGFTGNATLFFAFSGIACVTTTVSVRVVDSSVQQTTLVCSQCPDVIAYQSDPLSQQLPNDFPSMFPSSFITVRRLLLDGRVVTRMEPVLVVAGTSVLVNSGRILGVGEGVSLLSTEYTPGQTITVTVLHRWAVDAHLLCNGMNCESPLELTPVGDGASLPPFLYSTSLVLSLSLTLVNGSVANFPWLAGFTPLVNDTDMDGLELRQLVYGPLTVRVRIAPIWDIHAHDISNGFQQHVATLSSLSLVGPSTLYQVHCSGYWEEARYTTTGTLSDGVSRVVPAVYEASPPLVLHHSSGLFHAELSGRSELTASFGGQQVVMVVGAVDSSRFFTEIALDFLPDVWNAPIDTQMELSPTLTPVLIEDPWFPVKQLASRVLHWTSSAPDVIEINADGSAVILRGDSYHAVTVTAVFRPCGGALVGPHTSVSKEITVNVAPKDTGDMDVGQESGLPLSLTPVGGIMQIPVFLYVSPSNHLQSYMVEMEIPGSGVAAEDCQPGSMANSQCALVGHNTFRAVGAFSQSQLVGRILVATVRFVALLDALAVMNVRLLQGLVGGALMLPRIVSYVIRLGTGALSDGSLVVSPSRRKLMPPGTAGGVGRVFGDTDGDGLFTALDVLFMENYIALAVFSGTRMICVVREKCVSTTRLSAWQLQQLNPVRHPALPAARPDGSDLLFLLMALVGKTFFLESLDVRASPGALAITVQLRDFMQRSNPDNAMVEVGLVTTSNRGLFFDSPYTFQSGASTLMIVCQRTARGYVASTLSSAVTVDEASVGLRVYLRALDENNSPASAKADDRRFVFKPLGPVSMFSIVGTKTLMAASPPTVTYLPTLNCEFLCGEPSLFLDQSLGTPLWLNDTALVVAFVPSAPPVFRGVWRAFKRVQLAIPDDTPESLEIPAEEGTIIVGAVFNVTLPSTPEDGVHGMDVYTVQSSPPIPLLAVYGAESPVLEGGAPVFFTNRARARDVHLVFRMQTEGEHDITVTRVDSSLGVSLEKGLPQVVLRRSVVGVVDEITHIRTKSRCATAGVILWSKLLPSMADESCEVDVSAHTRDGDTISRQALACTKYPCILQVYGQAIRPFVRVIIPRAVRVLVQRPVFSLSHRMPWRIECDTEGPLPVTGLTITERAINAGLVQAHPPNTLAITPASIQGLVAGFSTISFGRGHVVVGLNVTDTVNPPRTLQAILFTSVQLDGTLLEGTATAVFQTPPVVAGRRFFLLLRAIYSGGYTLLLDPTPGADDVVVTAASTDLVVSQADGSVIVRAGASGGVDVPLVEIEYQGIHTVIRGDVTALTPVRIKLCCDVVLASPKSNMYGHPVFPSSFAISSLQVVLTPDDAGNEVSSVPLRLDDSAIRVMYDTSVLSYDRSSGIWALISGAPAWGVSEITVLYTHPRSMETVHEKLRVTMVDAGSLTLTGAAVLHRIHCSATVFQSDNVYASLRMVPLSYTVEVDVTAELDLLSSDSAIVQVRNRFTRGVAVGAAEISATVRGKHAVLPVVVTDDSVVFQSISAPPSYDLRGVKGVTRFPVVLTGILFSGGQQDVSALATYSLDENSVVSLDFSQGEGSSPSFVIIATSYHESGVSLYATLPSCSSSGASSGDLGAVSRVNTRAVAANASVDVEIDLEGANGGTRLTVFLSAPPPFISFYIQLQTDASGFTACVPLDGLPLLSDCVTDSPVTGSIIVAGATSTSMEHVTKLVALDTESAIGSVWGFVEIFTGISAVRYSVQAGELLRVVQGSIADVHNNSVSALMPGLPTVDTATLSRSFRGLFSVPKVHDVRDTHQQLLVLMTRLRNVDARVYSNEFELSAMFFVTDRFLRPDSNTTIIRVCFHTDEFEVPDSTLEVGVGQWVVATYVLEGLYAVELRQNIPRMTLSISFTVESPLSQGKWLWHLATPVEIGQAVPPCPRSASQTATFLASYQIYIPDNLGEVSASAPKLDALLGQIACSVHVAARRVMFRSDQPHTLTLTVALESLARVHHANLALMGGWLAKEMERQLFGANTTSGIAIQRGELAYINDTRDPPRVCPYGYYFTRNGTYMLLPPHSIAGEDCYDMLCVRGYVALTSEITGHVSCVPTPVPMDIVWVCIVVILTSVLVLASLACCIKFALWSTAKDVGSVVFDPAEGTKPPAPAPDGHDPSAPPGEWMHDPPDADNPFKDSFECDAYFKNVVMYAGMDEYSMSMMMDEDSPRPLDYVDGFAVRSTGFCDRR